MTITYYGDDITIEEMPQGCVISSIGDDRVHQYVVVASTRDALELIASLEKMIRVQIGEN